MAAKTTSIPRFLLPQYGSMWRTGVRSGTFARPLNAEVGQVIVRHVSNTARRPAIASSAATNICGSRAASGRAAAKAFKNSAPTRPLRATASKPASNPPASEPVAQAATPENTSPASKRAPQATAPENAPPLASDPVAQAIAPKPTPTARPAVDPSKPIVLEKPERFNPPSHGARLPRSRPKHYGGPTTAAEYQAQSQRTYPGLPPPPNTFASWFINSRAVHMFITMGTLSSLAIYTFVSNFKANSPFVDLIPPISEFPWYPFQYIGVCIDVIRMHEEHESARVNEQHRRKVEDITKRNEYRKAHGLEPATPGLRGEFAAAATTAPGPTHSAIESSSEPMPDNNAATELPSRPNDDAAAELPADGKRKKFLGLF
ncbi:hypothetical protein GGR50DRAFT_371626 [Xylaria sp. CBS 124048]|nr:hypothetical protein GGR50DRAFT_371626 [Xylaria sp. CBS 124048]